MITFEDALRVVQGFQKAADDGGYCVKAYQCGIADVVKVLKELSKRWLEDQQMVYLHHQAGADGVVSTKHIE